jgi:P-type Cu+ transporter
MRTTALIALTLTLLAGSTGCSKEPPAAAPPAAATAGAPTKVAQVWTCPMDKEVVSDKPGSCPKCGMKLELKK